MAVKFRKLLCPIDFDRNSMYALDTAADIARDNAAMVYLLHAAPLFITPEVPVPVDIFKGQQQVTLGKLRKVAREHLGPVKFELLAPLGEPVGAILDAQKKVGANLIVMATHGRRGLKRALLGSVAERVVRQASCPVLTVRQTSSAKRVIRTRKRAEHA